MSVEKLITENLELWTGAVTQKSASGRGSSSKRELTGIKKLRELILELAVRGKLVPQNPDDQPATQLLAEIQEERELMAAKWPMKKVRKPKAPLEENVCVSLPSSWALCSLPDVYFSISPSGKKLKTSEISESGAFPVVDQGQSLIAGYSDDADLLIEPPRAVVVFGDHTKARKYIDFEFVAGADGTKILCPLKVDPRFFFLQLLSYDLEHRGYARHFKVLNEQMFALPPLAEQPRIVQKVDELMALCDQLEQQTGDQIEAHERLVDTLLDTLTRAANATELAENWARVQQHFDTLFTTEHSIDRLKQTILQLAVMGRLVPQRNEEEPAVEMIQQIESRRDELVKQGATRRLKGVLPISAEDQPFETPEGWSWVRLASMSEKVTDGEHSTPERSTSGYYLLSARNVRNEGIALSDVDFVPNHEFERLRKRCDPNIGDLLISCSGSIGRVVQVDKSNAYVMVRSAAMVRPVNGGLDLDYLCYCLRSPELQAQMTRASRQSAQANLFLGAISNLVIPVPPRKEQIRIARKLDRLLGLCDDVLAGVMKEQSLRDRMADSVLEMHERLVA